MNQAPHILTIDLGAIAENYGIVKAVSGEAAVGASIKADAYGLGAEKVGPALYKAGCRSFFVATVEEGIRLRGVLPETAIYIFAGIHGGDREAFGVHNLRPCLNSLADIAAWAGGPCAVFFDTGMNRLGLDATEAARLIAEPDLLARCDVRLFLSHFACSEDTVQPMNLEQCARIDAIRAVLAPHYPHVMWSMCNSSGAFHYPQVHYDLIRAGYALYGGNPTPDKPNPMRPVVTLEAWVLQTRLCQTGESIGYSATYRFDAPTETATICLGYADGFFRSQSSRAQVYFNGEPCPVLGRVSMDLVTIGINHLKRKPVVGDMIEVLGPHQDIEALARSGQTIGYEILTSLGSRYARVYKP